MAKKTDWKDALKGLGAKSSPITPNPTGVTVGRAPEREYHEPALASMPEIPMADGLSSDPASYPEWALAWAAAGIQIMGRTALVRGLYDAQGGSGREASAFCDLVERRLDAFPQARAIELRAQMVDLWGGKGVPTFCGRARTVMEAVQSGAVDAWLESEREQASQAEALVVPEPIEGEEIEAYRVRLDAWSADKPAGILKRIGFDAYGRAETERKRREEARKAAEAKKLDDAIAAFRAGGSFEELAATLGSEYVAKSAVARTPRAWEMYRVGKSDQPVVEPTAEWLAGESDVAWLVKQAKPTVYGSGQQFGPLFHGRLIAVLPSRPTADTVVIVHTPTAYGTPTWMSHTSKPPPGCR